MSERNELADLRARVAQLERELASAHAANRHQSVQNDFARAVFEGSAVGMARVSFADAKLIDVNHAFCQMLGYTLEEFLATPWPDITHPDDVSLDMIPFQQMAAGEVNKYSVEKRFIHKAGQFVWARLTLSLVRDAQGKPDFEVAVIEDITERRRTRQELEAREQQYRELNVQLTEKVNEFEALLQVTPVGIGIARDRGCRVIQQNPALAAMLGVPAGENPSKSGAESDRLPFRVLQNGTELNMMDLPMQVAAREGISIRDFPLDIVRDGGTTANLLGHADPLRDSSGCVIGCVGAFVDVTAMRNVLAALERSNQDLQQFASAASHDLQAPLRILRSFTDAIDRRLKGKIDADTEQFLQFVTDAAQQMSKLIQDLLAFARAGNETAQQPPVTSVEHSFEAALAAVRESVCDANATILHDALPEVRAHSTHVRQLFQNLLDNGIKYRDRERAPLIQVTAQRENRCWRFAVSDNGRGFPEDQAERIFEPFKRLHGSDIPGSGIGLATCKRIVERYGGRIWAESAVGVGSCFFFTLPAGDDE